MIKQSGYKIYAAKLQIIFKIETIILLYYVTFLSSETIVGTPNY